VADDFDPYYKWLGIAPEDQPANNYQLLGVRNFESDGDVLAMAADRQMAHLRSFQGGKRAELSQKILNEVSAARLCLLNDGKKKIYDLELRQEIEAKEAKKTKASQKTEGPQGSSIGSKTSALREPDKVNFESKKKKRSPANAEQPIAAPEPSTPAPVLTPLKPLSPADAFEEPALDATVIGSGIHASGGSSIGQRAGGRPAGPQTVAAGGSAIGRAPAMPDESRLVFILIGSAMFMALTLLGIFMSYSFSRGASRFSKLISGAVRRAPRTPGPTGPSPPVRIGGRPTVTPPVERNTARLEFYWPMAARGSGRITLDGRPIRPGYQGSIAVIPTSPGRHHLIVHRRSFRTASLFVQAEPGKTTRVHPDWQTGLSLRPGSPPSDLAAVAAVGAGPGQWTRLGSSLNSPNGIPTSTVLAGINKSVAEEYVIELRAMRTLGTGPLQIGLAQSSHRFSLLLGGDSGVAISQHQGSKKILTPTSIDPLPVGRLRTVRIYVAPGVVSVEVRGMPVRYFREDFTSLQREAKWHTSAPLSVGVENASFRISSIRMYSNIE